MSKHEELQQIINDVHNAVPDNKVDIRIENFSSRSLVMFFDKFCEEVQANQENINSITFTNCGDIKLYQAVNVLNALYPKQTRHTGQDLSKLSFNGQHFTSIPTRKINYTESLETYLRKQPKLPDRRGPQHVAIDNEYAEDLAEEYDRLEEMHERYIPNSPIRSPQQKKQFAQGSFVKPLDPKVLEERVEEIAQEHLDDFDHRQLEEDNTTVRHVTTEREEERQIKQKLTASQERQKELQEKTSVTVRTAESFDPNQPKGRY